MEVWLERAVGGGEGMLGATGGLEKHDGCLGMWIKGCGQRLVGWEATRLGYWKVGMKKRGVWKRLRGVAKWSKGGGRG